MDAEEVRDDIESVSKDAIVVFEIEEIERNDNDQPIIPPSRPSLPPILFLDEDDVFWCVPQIVYPTPATDVEIVLTHENNEEEAIGFQEIIGRLIALPVDDDEMIALIDLDDQRKRDFLINIKCESET